MENNIHTKVEIVDITKEDLPELAKNVSIWQKNTDFMRFLKETPMTEEQNLAIFQKKMESPHVFKGIIERVKGMIGFVLFHNFDLEKKECEISMRIDPSMQNLGIGTKLKIFTTREVLAKNLAETIISWHSVWNKGTLKTNKKAGFKIVDFVPQQTFLVNIGKQTDDLKRVLNKDMLILDTDDIIDPSIDKKKRVEIEEGLKKHDLFIS